MAKSEAKAKREGIHCVWTTCAADSRLSRLSPRKIQTVFLARFSRLLSSKILQNNLLDLYLVEIRRYKLSFFAKGVTNTPRCTAIFPKFWKIVAWSSKLPGGWNWVHNWLNLLTSCGPNVGAIGSNASFCEGDDLIGPEAPISPRPEDIDIFVIDKGLSFYYFTYVIGKDKPEDRQGAVYN